MGQLRMEKVQELMKQEISKILLQDVKDPGLGFVTVTDVHCSPDLRNARVFVSLMGNGQQMRDSLRALKRCSGYIRREMGSRVRLRYTPELTFAIDTSLAYSAHIQELLLKIEKEEGQGNGDADKSE